MSAALEELRAQHEQNPLQVLAEQSRRRVTLLPGDVVCKEERHLGLLGPLRRRVLGSRASRGQEAARALRAAGFAAPEPLGALELPERTLSFFRRVEGPNLSAALREAERAEARALAVAAATLAARLQQAGFAVRDLKPPNLIVDPSGALVLVDLDDVRQAPARVGRYAWRNLAALDAYAQLGPRPLGISTRRAALRAYCEERSLALREVLAAVLPLSRAKLARLRAREVAHGA